MNPSQKANQFESEKVTLIILFCILAVWSFFSFTNWIGDSEFWPITLSGHWNQWLRQPALQMKPFFHLVLTWIYFFDLDSVGHIRVAKGLFTLFGVASFILLYSILKREVQHRKALCIVLILLFSHLGFTQTGLIRSDFLSFFVTLMFFYISPRLSEKSWKQFGIVNFVFSLILYMISPKSLFFALFIFVYSLYKIQKGAKFRFILMFGWLWIISFTLVDQFILRGAGSKAFDTAVSFAVESYYTQKNEPFFDLRFRGYFFNDILIWLMIITGLCYQLFENKKPHLNKWSVLGLLTLMIIISYKPALPFFVGSYWGILFLSLIPLYKKIDQKHFYGFLAVTLSVFVFRYSHVYHYSNEVQLQAVREIDGLSKDLPKAKIFDGLGVAPRSPNYLYYLGPGEERSNLQIMDQVLAVKPEIIIYTARMDLIKDELNPFIRDNYEPIGVGYWLRNDLKNLQKNLGHLRPAFFVFGFYPVPVMLKN